MPRLNCGLSLVVVDYFSLACVSAAMFGFVFTSISLRLNKVIALYVNIPLHIYELFFINCK